MSDGHYYIKGIDKTKSRETLKLIPTKSASPLNTDIPAGIYLKVTGKQIDKEFHYDDYEYVIKKSL